MPEANPYHFWNLWFCQLLKIHIVFLGYMKAKPLIFCSYLKTGNIVGINFVNHPPHTSIQVAEFVNASISLISTLWRITFHLHTHTHTHMLYLKVGLKLPFFKDISKIDNLSGITKRHAGLFGCTCSIHSECIASWCFIMSFSFLYYKIPWKD